MPKHRPPTRIWHKICDQIYRRDRGFCRGPYCRQHGPYPRHQVHVDHIKSGKRATNKFRNLRLLCRRCHVLRLDQRHRGMIASALRDGIIPPDWRRFCWDDELLPTEEIIAEMVQWIASQETKSEL